MSPIARTALLCALAACASAPPAATPSSPPPASPPPAPAPPPAAVELTQLGSPCSAACTAPASCATYYGIAGPSGPAFTSCEVSCTDDKTGCPAGTTCITIADGPGAVCRRGDR